MKARRKFASSIGGVLARSLGARAVTIAGAVIALASAAACATTSADGAARAAVSAGRLIAPMTGYYAIYRSGERVGTERFTITATGGVWRTRGTVELDEPVEIVHGYDLIVDPVSEEPLGFDVWVEIAGARERALGSVEGPHVRVDVDSVMGKGSGKVPYARGTVIDFASPLSNTLVLSLLVPGLAVGGSARVRTIAIALPLLAPSVIVQRYTRVATDDGVHKVTVDQEDGHTPPTALWVRADGLPIKVKTWPEGGGAPYEMWLHEGVPPEDAEEED